MLKLRHSCRRCELTKILIVEDEAIIAEGMSVILTTAGHHVVGIATDEASAVKQAAAGRPDLVLMDVKLANGSDGIETARCLQAQGPVSLVFVSAHLDTTTRQRAAAVHPAGYLAKPYSPEKLLEAVLAVGGGKRHQGPRRG